MELLSGYRPSTEVEMFPTNSGGDDDSQRTRRGFIGAVAAVSAVGLTGCSGGDGTGTPTDEPMSTMTETATPTPDLRRRTCRR